MILAGVSVMMISLGLLFFFGAAMGVLRFPDFYTRMHAAGKGDTLSTLLILGGIALWQMRHFTDNPMACIVVMVKILAICLFIMVTSPTSTHALMEAGYEDGIEPMIAEDGENCFPESDIAMGQGERSK